MTNKQQRLCYYCHYYDPNMASIGMFGLPDYHVNKTLIEIAKLCHVLHSYLETKNIKSPKANF